MNKKENKKLDLNAVSGGAYVGDMESKSHGLSSIVGSSSYVKPEKHMACDGAFGFCPGDRETERYKAMQQFSKMIR